MDDKEMIRLAAKAAGFKVILFPTSGRSALVIAQYYSANREVEFSPLDNGLHAMWLVERCHIELQWRRRLHMMCRARIHNYQWTGEWNFIARWAITQCAADFAAGKAVKI